MPAIIGRAVAQPVTSFMQTIGHQQIPGGGANTDIRVSVLQPTKRFRKQRRDIRLSINSLARFRPANA